MNAQRHTMMTQGEDLNLDEKNAIEDLQMRIKSALPQKLIEDPTVFHRFLKARNFDVDKAEKMLRKHIHWRKVNQTDTMLEDFKPKEAFRNYCDARFIGLDKDGDLIVYLPSGKTDTKAMLRCIKMNDYFRHSIWIAERIAAFVENLNKQGGRNSSQITVIFDLDKLTFSNATYRATTEYLLRLIHVVQDNHPERLKVAYVINAPGFFVLIYSIFKAVMSHAMIQKINIIGHSGWKEKLLEKIDADVLPAFLGGKRTDPDGNPLCNTFIVHGGKPPPQYFLSNEDRYFKNTDEVKKIIIPQLGKKEVYVDVTESGSMIKWKFLVKSNDIGFGLSLETCNQDVIEILPVERYITSDGTEEYLHKTKYTGKYIIIFDNSYSWWNSKEIHYCLEISKSEQNM